MSKEALPQIQISQNMEKDINENEMMEYLDTENFEFDKDKKALFEKVMRNSQELEAIGHLAKDLNHNIDGLDGKIHNILTKHHKDYITTFNEFMDTVRKDLKEKIERMERIEKDKRKNENILLIITERDFFRQEAIRLNQLCKELSIKVESMNKEMKFLSSEVNTITNRWKDSENTNKQLVIELERNVKTSKDLENKLKNIHASNNNYNGNNNNNNNNFNYNNTSSNFNNIYANGNSQDNFNLNNIMNENSNLNNYLLNNNLEDFDVNNIQFLNSKEKDKIIKIIEKLKFELKKERTRNNKIIGEFNKILLDKNKLEKIFIECVEEIRKDIMHRKLKDNLNNTKNNFNNFINIQNQKKKEAFPVINDIKFENFLSTDKKKLIEIFIAKDEVVNFLRENIFKVNFDEQKKNEKMFGMKTMGNFNFPNGKNNKRNNTSFNFFTMNVNRSKTPNII